MEVVVNVTLVMTWGEPVVMVWTNEGRFAIHALIPISELHLDD